MLLLGLPCGGWFQLPSGCPAKGSIAILFEPRRLEQTPHGIRRTAWAPQENEAPIALRDGCPQGLD